MLEVRSTYLCLVTQLDFTDAETKQWTHTAIIK